MQGQVAGFSGGLPGNPVGVLILVKTCGGDRYQLAVGIILHGLSHFPQQGNVVKVTIVGITLIGQRDPDPLHGFGRLLGNDADTGELPLVADVRIEGDVMSLGGTVGISDRGTQAALLGDIVRIIQFAGIIRNRVGSRPAGENIGLGTWQIQSDVLISVGAGAQGVTGDLQRSGRACHTIGAGECRVGTHGPAVRSLHIAVCHQIVAGGSVSFFYLEVIGVEGADCAVVIDKNAVFVRSGRGKGDTDPNPAVIHSRGGDVVYPLAGPALTAVGNGYGDAAALNFGYGAGVYIAGNGIRLSGGQGTGGDQRVLAAAAQSTLDGIGAGSGFSRGTAGSVIEGPAACAIFQAGIAQQLLPGNADGAGTERPVVRLVGGAAAGIDRVGCAQNIPGIVCSIGVDSASGVVKQVMRQHIVAVSGNTVRSMIPVHRFAVIRVSDGDGCARPGVVDLLISGHLAIGIGERETVAAYITG